MEATIKEAGLTSEEAWNQWGMEDMYGPYEGPKSWDKDSQGLDCLSGFEGFKPDELNCYTIDSGTMCAGTIPGLEKALNLIPVKNPDIAAVKQMNYEVSGANIAKNQEILQNHLAKWEERLASSQFLGGESPSEEDQIAYM